MKQIKELEELARHIPAGGEAVYKSESVTMEMNNKILKAMPQRLLIEGIEKGRYYYPEANHE